MHFITGLGTKVLLELTSDCGVNEGGYYVEVYLYDDEIGDYDMDMYYDSFCIHPEDCDCSDSSAIENFCNKYVSSITDY